MKVLIYWLITMDLLLLLLLSGFSHVQFCVTPQMAAHQSPPSLRFSRQEHWSGLHFLLQCMKVKSESKATQSCPTHSDPRDCSLPGSSTHGIFQARVLEWVAIAFCCVGFIWLRQFSFPWNKMTYNKVSLLSTSGCIKLV